MDDLLTALKSHPDYQKATPVYLSVYLKASRYGGPEEGGWWKHYLVLEGSIRFACRAAALRGLEELRKKIEQQNALLARVQREKAIHCLEDPDAGDQPLNPGESLWDDQYVLIFEEEPGSNDNTHERIGRWDG